MERDTESGQDHTLYRQFGSGYGRWYSLDQMSGDASHPQSWNRYAYVINNPVTLTDPLGLRMSLGCTPFECDLGGGGAGAAEYIVDGVETSTTLGQMLVDMSAAVQCPNNTCSMFGKDPLTGGQAWLQFYAGAGGATGYLSGYDSSQGWNEVNGSFLSNSVYQAYVQGNFLDAINSQLAHASRSLRSVRPRRLARVAASMEGGAKSHPQA